MPLFFKINKLCSQAPTKGCFSATFSTTPSLETSSTMACKGRCLQPAPTLPPTSAASTTAEPATTSRFERSSRRCKPKESRPFSWNCRAAKTAGSRFPLRRMGLLLRLLRDRLHVHLLWAAAALFVVFCLRGLVDNAVAFSQPRGRLWSLLVDGYAELAAHFF